MRQITWLMILTFCFGTNKVLAESDYCKRANNLAAQYADKVQNQKRLNLYEIGGSMMHTIQVFSFGFTASNPSTITEARTLIINLTTEFLKIVNDSKNIRPYLINYPFLPSNIELEVRFQKPTNSSQDLYLAYVSLENGKLVYAMLPLNTDIYSAHPKDYQDIKESFDDAIKLLQ